MGIKLKMLFDDIGREKGIAGRMKLAMLTSISSSEALALEDSAANLKLVGDAAAQLLRQP